MFYRQCRLEKALQGAGVRHNVAWIPEHFAVRGKVLTIAGDRGWRVALVSASRKQESDINENEYRVHRRITDI